MNERERKKLKRKKLKAAMKRLHQTRAIVTGMEWWSHSEFRLTPITFKRIDLPSGIDPTGSST